MFMTDAVQSHNGFLHYDIAGCIGTMVDFFYSVSYFILCANLRLYWCLNSEQCCFLSLDNDTHLHNVTL